MRMAAAYHIRRCRVDDGSNSSSLRCIGICERVPSIDTTTAFRPDVSFMHNFFRIKSFFLKFLRLAVPLHTVAAWGMTTLIVCVKIQLISHHLLTTISLSIGKIYGIDSRTRRRLISKWSLTSKWNLAWSKNSIKLNVTDEKRSSIKRVILLRLQGEVKAMSSEKGTDTKKIDKKCKIIAVCFSKTGVDFVSFEMLYLFRVLLLAVVVVLVLGWMRILKPQESTSAQTHNLFVDFSFHYLRHAIDCNAIELEIVLCISDFIQISLRHRCRRRLRHHHHHPHHKFTIWRTLNGLFSGPWPYTLWWRVSNHKTVAQKEKMKIRRRKKKKENGIMREEGRKNRTQMKFIYFIVGRLAKGNLNQTNCMKRRKNRKKNAHRCEINPSTRKRRMRNAR